MFCNIKDKINTNEVKNILADCVFDNSPNALKKEIERYIAYSELKLYGWVEDDIILGVAGFEIHKSRLEICHIAVLENTRHRGIGKKMISVLREKYKLPIEAETDDDAVEFYRKCKFEITPIQKYNVTRYICVLNTLLTLLYGTSNAGKLDVMREYLAGLDINIIGLNDIDIKLPEIDESGNNPLENAKIKAIAYYKATGMPVFSCDSGLFIKDAPDELQPGVHVRNVGGKYLDDEEMISYYSSLAVRLGGQMTVRYKNGICLIMSEREIYEHMGDDIASEEFNIVSKPHNRKTPGFPIDSLSVHTKTGKYYYDMDELKDPLIIHEGFRKFFIRTLGLN